MSYEYAPDFMSGQPAAAWYIVLQRREGEPANSTNARRVRICATHGRSFVWALQTKLNQYLRPRLEGTWEDLLLPGSADRSAWDNWREYFTGGDTRAPAERFPALVTSGTWDQATARQLALACQLLARERSGDEALVLAERVLRLQAAANQQVVTEDALRTALWFTYLRDTPNGLDSVFLDPRTIYPQFGVAPQPGATPSLEQQCFYPDSERAPWGAAQDPGPSPYRPGPQDRPGDTTGPGTLDLFREQRERGSVAPLLVTVATLAGLGGLYVWSRAQKSKRSHGKALKAGKRRGRSS